MAAKKLVTHTCKMHDHTHPYKRCRRCNAEYCDRRWLVCPRCAGAVNATSEEIRHMIRGGGGARTKDASVMTLMQELTHPTKPIVISRMKRGYAIHVNGIPLVVSADGLGFSRQPEGVNKRPKLAPPGSPIHVFAKLEDAKDAAHKIGHYMMRLGDMVFAYTALPSGSRW